MPFTPKTMAALRVKDGSHHGADGHATGLLGLPAVLHRLSDPSHRCQGPELTCLLQALSKQLVNAASDTSLAIFSSADGARAAAAQTAAADVTADLSIGAPEQCVPSPQPLSSGFGCFNARSHSDIEVPASSQALPNAVTSTSYSPSASALAQQHLHRAHNPAARGPDAAASCRPPAGPSKVQGPALAATVATAQASAAQALPSSALAGLSPAASEPTQGLAGMVASGIALLVDHLEHFHYRAKAVALDGLLSLSAIGLGPDRRLDPAGFASPSLAPGGTSQQANCQTAAAAAIAAAAAMAAAAAGGDGDSQQQSQQDGALEPGAVAEAVQALGGLGLGDWLALRIIGAGAVPRLLEMLTQRSGINFVPVRQLASQVVHNLARRRNAAVRAALIRWRPLPGVISALDVVLEDSPEIAARILLVLSDLLPITSHQVAGVLHKLIAKHGQPQEQAALQQQQLQLQQSRQQQQQQQQLKEEDQAAPSRPETKRQAAAEQPAAQDKVRTRSKTATQAAAAAPAGRAAGAAAAPSVQAGRPRRGTAAAAAAAADGKKVNRPAAVAPEPAPAPAAAPVAPVAPAAAATADLLGEASYLGLAPDVDVPLEQLLMRVMGYYMRLAYNAVLAPAPLPPPVGIKAPYGDVERRDYEKTLLLQKLDEHRRRRKEAGQLDCCVAALLAAAPLPNCLFDALSYSHARAFAVLTGPPMSVGLTSTTNGGLWRAQDLLPYALAMLQGLGGGSDTGDSGGCLARSTVANPAGSFLLPLTAGANANASGGSGVQSYSSSGAVAAALDRFWGLEHPRSSVLGPAGNDLLVCAGPALPGAPYGDKPVAEGLMHQTGIVIRAVLERSIQAASSLSVNAGAAAAATANGAASNAPLAAGVLAAQQACADAPPLGVLRSVAGMLSSITRAQLAGRITAFTDCLARLAASLSQHTGSAAAGVAQARMALGLANVWACVHAAALCRRRRVERHQRRLREQRQQEAAKSPVKDAQIVEKATPAAPAEGSEPAEPAAPGPRRSARIKRRREGVQGAAGGAAAQDKQPVTEPAAQAQEAHVAAVAATPAAATAAAEAPEAVPAAPSSPPEARVRRDALLLVLVDLLAARFSEVRQLQISLDDHQRQQEEQPESEGAAAASPALAGRGPSGLAPNDGTASGVAGSWLAAAAAAAVVTPADKARLALETKAVLLQAVALILPGMDASHARRLLDAGAAHCCARLIRPTASAPAVTGASAAATATGTTAPTMAERQQRGVAATASEQSDGDALTAPWSSEPTHGVTAAQSLGLLIQLLQLSEGGSYGSGGLQQPEALAALGGALLMRAPNGGSGDGGRGGAPELLLPSLVQQQPQSSPSRRTENAKDGEVAAEEPTARCWDLLRLLSSGFRPCAYHDAVLQLLVPLVALTHGSSPRCAASRAALVPVLVQIMRWNHSKVQRRRIFLQAAALWAPHLQPLLLRLPRTATPAVAIPDAQLASAAPATDGPAPSSVAAVPVKLSAAARTQSQSTMPYNTSRGGRYGTPTTGIQGPASGSAAATTHVGQRTPPWGTCLAAAAAGATSGTAGGSSVTAAAAVSAAIVLSPTQHNVSGSGVRMAAVPSAMNPMRSRRGSRLAGLVSPPPPLPPLPRTSGGGMNDGEACGAGVAAGTSNSAGAAAAVGVEAQASSLGGVTLGSLCELLEVAMERIGDAEVVRHLHMSGWLVAMCHGAQGADAAVRESCQRALAHAVRSVAAAGRPLPAPLLAELEVDVELRNQLCLQDPILAAQLQRRRLEAPLSLRPYPPSAEGGSMSSGLGLGLPPACGAMVFCGRRRVGPGQAPAGAAWPPRPPSQLGRPQPPQPLPEVPVTAEAGDKANPAKEAAGETSADTATAEDQEQKQQRFQPVEGPGEDLEAEAEGQEQASELLPLQPEPTRRGSRRRGATSASTRGRKATRGGASGTAAVASAAGGPSTRSRSRKGTAARRVVSGAEVAAEPEQEDRQCATIAAPTAGISEAAANGAGLAAPAGHLVSPSPLPKRRRVSESDGANDDEPQPWIPGAADGDGGQHDSSARAAKASATANCGYVALVAAVRPAAEGACDSSMGPGAVAATGTTRAAAAVVGCSGFEPVAPVELQLTAVESRLAAAVRWACVSLESALAARRHDLAAERAADQAAAAAAAAAATMAVAAAAAGNATSAAPAADEAPVTVAAAAPPTGAPAGAKKKTGRSRVTAPAAAATTRGLHAKQPQAAVPVPAQPVVPAPVLLQKQQPVAVADEEFLSRTYRGVSKRLNFDDM